MDPALKHRLIGAAVLSALAIIFLPMLIVGRDRNDSAASVPLTLPAAPAGDFQTKDLPLVAPAAGVPSGGVTGMDASHPPTPATTSSAASPAASTTASPVASGAQSPVATTTGARASDGSSPAAPVANPGVPSATNPASLPAAAAPGIAKAASPAGSVAPGIAPANPPVAISTAPDAAAIGTPSGPIPSASAGGHYVVSLGTYASPANAQSLVNSLKGAQLPAYAEAVTVAGKQATRVRIGPFGQRGDAETARLKAQQVRKDMPASVTALDAAVPAADVQVAPARKPTAPLTKPAEQATAAGSKPGAPIASPAASGKTTFPPTSAAAATSAPDKPATPSPAASGRGYAVQVSAYRTEAEALALRNKLRAAGFTAFSERIQADSGTMYRVRIGPEADRDAADKLRAELSAKMSLNGMVVGYP